MGQVAVINDYNANLIPDGVSNEQGALVEPTAVALYGVDRAKVGAAADLSIARTHQEAKTAMKTRLARR